MRYKTSLGGNMSDTQIPDTNRGPRAAMAGPVGRARPAANGLFRMVRTVAALMLREISTTYGRSPGGYIWALADPILGIGLLTLVFQVAMGQNRPLIGTSFPLFYASGYLIFQMYHDIANKVAVSLRFSRPLLAYPSVTFVDALFARLILNMMTHIIVVAVVISGILFFSRLPMVMDVATILHALGLTTLFAAGLGTMNCFLFMRFPVWERAWSILSRPLFLMSGVFFTYELMPNMVRDVLWWNPVLHLVGLMRRGIYVVYPADYVSEFYVVSLSLGLLVAGLLLIWRRYRNLLEMV